MATLSANFAESMETRQKMIFFQQFKMRDLTFPQFMERMSSSKAFEDRMRIAGVGQFQTKPEGTPVAFSDPIEGTRRRVVHQTFALGYRVSMEAQMDDQWGYLNKIPGDLALSGRHHMEILAHDVINDGWAGVRHTGLDGAISLFNTAHPSLRPEVAVQSNAVSPAIQLSQTGIEAIMIMAMTTQSEEGRFIDLTHAILLIHPTEIHNARILMDTQQQVGSANNDINTVQSNRSGLKIVPSPYLTNVRSWSIHSPVGDNSLCWYDRAPMSFNRAKDSDSFDDKHYAWYRASATYNEWRGNWGSNFV